MTGLFSCDYSERATVRCKDSNSGITVVHGPEDIWHWLVVMAVSFKGIGCGKSNILMDMK